MKRLLLALLCVSPLVLSGGEPAPPMPTAPAATKIFALRFTTGPGWDPAKPFQAQKHIAAHSANLLRMQAEGIAISGGRFSDTGLVLVRAADEAAVRAQLARDPSLEAGTFTVAIDEYRPFFRGAGLPPAESPEISVVRAALAAFNAHDPEALTALYADDIKWFSIDSDKQSLEGESPAAIRTWLTGYFKSTPDVRSEISDLAQTGTHVSFRERASWTARDGTRRAQTSIAVYEVRGGKIKRAWYFPAARENPPVAPAAPSAPAAPTRADR